jgi:hypothetical protein
MPTLHLWDLWYPAAAATGLPFARGRLDPTDVLWVHAAPETLNVTIRDTDDRLIARAERLQRTTPRFPMTRLARDGDTITREDRWPAQADIGALVILPGGEVGRLTAWWNAPDGSEWRWQVEFYNHA